MLSVTTKISLVLFVLAFVLTFLLVSTLQREEPVGKDRELEEQIRAIIEGIKGRYPAVRNLTIPDQVNLVIVDRRWVQENWGRSINITKLKLDEAIFKALLIIDENYNLSDFMIGWSGLIMAASSGYDLYVVKDYVNLSDISTVRVLVHELTHIVQFHYFRPAYGETFDEKQAVSALVEGDADLTANLYVASPERTPQSNSGEDGELPRKLLLLWSFPYRYGENFVNFLYSIGGWKLVNNAYRNPPRSTEQVMHPEKYVDGEGFLVINATKPGDGWSELREDRMGEFFCYVVLYGLIDEEFAERASEGWNGDLLTLYTNGTHYLVEWSIAWDTEEDAVEFFHAMNSALRNAGGIMGDGTDNKSLWILGKKSIEISIEKDIVVVKSVLKPSS